MTTGRPESDPYGDSGDRGWNPRPAVPGWTAGQDYTGPLFDDTGWHIDLSDVDWGDNTGPDWADDRGAGDDASFRFENQDPRAGTAQVRQLRTTTARLSPQTGPVSPADATPGARGRMTSRPGWVRGPRRGRRVLQGGSRAAAAAGTAAPGGAIRLPRAARCRASAIRFTAVRPRAVRARRRRSRAGTSGPAVPAGRIPAACRPAALISAAGHAGRSTKSPRDGARRPPPPRPARTPARPPTAGRPRSSGPAASWPSARSPPGSPACCGLWFRPPPSAPSPCPRRTTTPTRCPTSSTTWSSAAS